MVGGLFHIPSRVYKTCTNNRWRTFGSCGICFLLAVTIILAAQICDPAPFSQTFFLVYIHFCFTYCHHTYSKAETDKLLQDRSFGDEVPLYTGGW